MEDVGNFRFLNPVFLLNVKDYGFESIDKVSREINLMIEPKFGDKNEVKSV